MKPSPAFAALFLLVVCALTPANAATPIAPPPASTPIVIGTSYKLRSSVLGDVREINVRLPSRYAKGREHFDVLYVIDGALAQDFEHIAGLAHLGELSGTYSSLIVVGIETKRRTAELTSPMADPRYRSAFPDGGGAERFRSFIAKEVIPFVEARFRTGKRRALIGESLAGFFVVDTLLKRPDMFNDYIAVSPSLWWDDRALASQAESLVRARPLVDRRLYLAVGDEGGTMQRAVDSLVATLRKSTPKGFELRYSDKSASETHSTIYHGAALEALRWLYAAPPYDYGPTPWFMIEGASPPARKTGS